MENIDPTQQQISCASPPCFSDDSIFFNLILGTKYENTKENCLQFLKNYSKTIFYPKRELFKMLINELTLNENSIKMLGNNESIYLLRQIIKKYSRHIVLNALYDFVNEKENDFFSPGNENNNINSTDDSMSRFLNTESEKDSKCGLNISNIIHEKNKEEEDEKNELSKEEENNNIKNNIQFLSKKRKLGKKKKLMLKRNDKHKKGKNVKKEIKVSSQKKDENQRENENGEKEIGKMLKEEKEKKIEKNGEEKQENEKEDYKMINNNNNKKENKQIVQNGEKKDDEYKNQLRKKSPNDSERKLTNYSMLKNIKKFFSQEKKSKIEKKDDLPLNNSSIITPIKSFNDNNKIENMQMDFLSYLNSNNEQINKFVKNIINENSYGCHLIKIPKDNFVYSYKIKRNQGIVNRIIYYECNNKKCRGRGEYDIDKEIFKETVSHNLSINSHKLSSMYYSFRDMLLMDKETNGYQLLKDNSFIRDKKIMLLLK